MTSPVIKRSIVIDGRKTSISIEDAFWRSLKEIASEKKVTISALVSAIKSNRGANSNLSSAIRVYILADLRERLHSLMVGGAPPDRASDRVAAAVGGPPGVR